MEILYEDNDIVAINKPTGLIVHSDGRTQEPSVSGWFIKKYPEAKDVGEPLGEIEKPGVVHRIDRDTSGVLLLAKTKEGHRHLKEQFREREIEKIYHLFVYGNIKEDSGEINLPISRSKKDFRTRVAKEGSGKVASTHFQILKRAQDKRTTFIEARPKTGRTHQLRAHFKALHHPIICDKLYAPNRGPLLGFNRLALHAESITFENLSGKAITLTAPYPDDFKLAIDTISQNMLD